MLKGPVQKNQARGAPGCIQKRPKDGSASTSEASRPSVKKAKRKSAVVCILLAATFWLRSAIPKTRENALSKFSTTSAITALCVRQRRSCLPRLTARRNRPNELRDWQQRSEIKTFPERFAPSIKFSTILDRISALMCVIFRIAKKSLSVQRE